MSSAQLRQYGRDPVAFIDDMIPLNEKGQPWRLSPHQRRVLQLAFRWDATGRLAFRLLLWSEVKKSGKSFLAACLVLWWAFVTPDTEVIVTANDLEQIVGRVFRTMVALCRWNPTLGGSVTIRATEIQVSNGTLITAIASDYRGAAGSRHSLYAVDEPWAFIHERATRLVEELTPPPTEPNAWGLMTTTAGVTGESEMLEGLYRRGLAGKRLDAELEVSQADELLMFWSHTPRQPWQTGEAGETYYAEQRRALRPATYLRMHENHWVTAETTFITPELWDGCVEEGLSPLLPTLEHPLFAGVDASTKHDSSAVVAVRWEGEKLALASHRIWRPSPAEPLDLEATIEQYLRDLHARYAVRKVWCDPFQLHRSITTLQAAGLPIREFPQTTANTTRMGQVLFDLLNGRNLRLYPAGDLRAQALSTVAVESPRGWRLAKEKASRKIDAIVALAMACVAALDERPARGPDITILDARSPHQVETAEELHELMRRETSEVWGRSGAWRWW